MSSERIRYVKFEDVSPITVGTIHLTSMLDALNVSDFGSEVVEYVEAHPGLRLILNFEKVDYLSSAALSELIRINDAAVSTDGKVRLCGLTKDIRKVFELTKLDGVFSIADDENVREAVRRFRRSVVREAEEEAWEQKTQDT